MRTNFTLMAILGLLFFGETPSLHAQSDTLYVRENAIGLNDGTSWENAFPGLQAALTLAEAGDEVWVAQGTYYPDTIGGASTSTFWMDKNIKLLGSFNGEPGSQANLQDPDLWISRLSGDLNQDDINDDLDSNRSDNVMTVLSIGLEVDGDATVDGFSIQNGHADGNNSAFQNRRGGGCFSYGSPLISRCVFDNNFAERGGGGLYFHTGNAEGAVVENCYFRENAANEGGGAMCFIQGGEGVDFLSCDFENNRANGNGGALRIYNSNCLLDDCQFQFNRANRGGAVDVQSIWDDNETQVLSSFFFENMARNGGAVHFQTNSGLGSHDNFLTVDGCEFFGNQAVAQNGGRQGGALRVNIERTTNGCGATVRNCDFTMNSSERDGGAISANLRGETMTFLLENSMVQDNAARNSGGVYVFATDVASGTASINGCDFFGNSAEQDGGGIRLLANRTSKLDFEIEDNSFFLNFAEENGGVIAIESRDTADMEVNILRNYFEENGSGLVGGVASVEANGSAFLANISHGAFLFNGSGSGSCLATSPSTSEGASLNVVNCSFTENDISDAVIVVDSFPQINLISNTLADNYSSALHVADMSGLYFQNNIFSNLETFEFASDNSISEYVSGGGNFIGDESMNALLGTLDQGNVNPLFDISPDGAYLLSMSSPAVDNGTLPDDVPDFDLAGNERVINCIDAGAYESPFSVNSDCLTNVDETSETNVGFSISPNPANEVIDLKWDVYFSEAQIELLNVDGQILRSEQILLTQNHRLNVSNLPSGVYWVRITTEKGREVKRVVVR